MADIARGVVAAHAQGVVHCDLKPANVLVTPSGRAMVADFGLSASAFLPVVDASDTPDRPHISATSMAVQTGAGHVVRGTPAYMSPEQARGEPAKPISDVYALGAVLFWLLSGQDPWASKPGETWRQLLSRIGQLDRPNPPLPAGTHPTLTRICLKAMRARPEQRYVSASAMLADLEAVLAQRVPEGVGPDSPWQPVWLWARRNALPLASSLAIIPVALSLLQQIGLMILGAIDALLGTEFVADAAAEVRREWDMFFLFTGCWIVIHLGLIVFAVRMARGSVRSALSFALTMAWCTAWVVIVLGRWIEFDVFGLYPRQRLVTLYLVFLTFCVCGVVGLGMAVRVLLLERIPKRQPEHTA
jgi:hypothetical protein